MAILDAHTHIFPPETIETRDRIASTDSAFSTIYGDKRARMAGYEALAAYMGAEGIDRAVAACFPFNDGGLIRLANDYVLDVARKDKRILPFVAVDRRNEDAAVSEAERCLNAGAYGVGEIGYYDGCFSERERKNLEGLARYLEETGMVLMLHLNEQVGHDYVGKTRIDFAEVVRFIKAHPALKIVLAHMGGGICFYEFMPEIRDAFSMVYYDLAAAPFLYSDALYAYCTSFLASKVLFGSDFPLLTLSRYRRNIDSLEAAVARKFLYDNGGQLLGV
jgi:predicted TIM-barrel fold metal-dependent hydrolase